MILGILVDKIGLKPAALSGFFLLFALAVFAIIARPGWDQAWFVVVFAFGYLIIDLYLKVSINPAAMRLCDPKVAATQFTLYMAIANLGITVASASLGWLDSLGGAVSMLAAMAIAALIGLGLFAAYASTGFNTNAVQVSAE